MIGNSTNKVKIDMELPANIQMQHISFIEKNGCKLQNYEIESAVKIDDEITKKLEELIEKKQIIQNKISSLSKENQLLSTMSLSKNEKSAIEIEKLTNFYTTKIFDNLNSITKSQKEIKSIENKIKNLQSIRSNQQKKKLKVEILCKKISNDSILSVTYPMRDFKKSSFSKIELNSKTKEISIKSGLFLTQSSGKDLKNIEVNYYSYSKNNLIKPRNFYPNYLNVYKKTKMLQRDTVSLGNLAVVESSQKVLPKSAPVYKDSETKSYYQISNTTLKSGIQKPLIFSQDNYKIEFEIEIDGYASATAFFKSIFKTDKHYNLANTKIYLDGRYIGTRYINPIKKDKKSELYFGEDLKIEVKKRLKKDFTENPFFGNRVITTKIYSYEMINNHNKPIKISFVERSPISKNEDIKVEIISKPKYDKVEPNGKTIWHFTLSPHEKKSIEFGYKIDKPK